MAKWDFVDWLLIWIQVSTDFEFEWDAGNVTKSVRKHGVSPQEVEKVFRTGLSLPLGKQISPPTVEDRFGLIGPGVKGRLVQVAFTFRSGKIRVISARVAHKKERIAYEEIKSKIAQGI